MKVEKLVLSAIVAGMAVCAAAGYWMLVKIDDAWFWPEVQFKSLRATTPDLASLKNLRFRESDGALVVMDQSKRAEFGFLRDHKYYRTSFDPSRHLGPDNSAHIVVIHEDGTKLADFPCEGPTQVPEPSNPVYMRSGMATN